MNYKSHFAKFAKKNGASYNKNPEVRNVQWGNFYSKFLEKKMIFFVFTMSHPPNARKREKPDSGTKELI